jgi:hypothetical protein
LLFRAEYFLWGLPLPTLDAWRQAGRGIRGDGNEQVGSDLVGTFVFRSCGPARPRAGHGRNDEDRLRAVNINFLPYPGTAPAISALLGEHITSVFAYSAVLEQLRAAKLRALAVLNADADRYAAECADSR